MKKLVIFGCGDIGQLAHFYFSTDSDYKVVAFTADTAYLPGPEFCGLPTVDFAEVAAAFPPHGHELFVAVSYAQLNALRGRKADEAKAKGYRLASYLSSRATLLTKEPIGSNCFLLEDNTVQPFAKIGHNVTLWSGNHIGHHCEIADDCFVTSHVVISGGVKVGRGCFLGVNSTLRDHITLGERCVVGAGAIVLADAPAESVFKAAPAELAKVPSSRLRHL